MWVINSEPGQPQIPVELIHTKLPMKPSPWWVVENICCPQRGVMANIPAQAWCRGATGWHSCDHAGWSPACGLSQGVYLRMNLRGHRAWLVSGGQRKISMPILKLGAVHLVHGLLLTRTNRAHLRGGHSPNKPVTLQKLLSLRAWRRQRVFPVLGKGWHTHGGRGQQRPAGHTFLSRGGDLGRWPAGGCPRGHTCAPHTDAHTTMPTCSYSCSYTPHWSTHPRIDTKPHTFIHQHTHTCIQI